MLQCAFQTGVASTLYRCFQVVLAPAVPSVVAPPCRPPEFESSSVGASQAADQLAALGLAESDHEEAKASPTAGSADAAQGAAAEQGAAGGSEQLRAGEGEESGYSSEDSLPPIPRFNNRKIIEYEVSDTESDD